MNDFKNLFSPITINKMTVKNRIFAPPMGTNRCTPKGESSVEMEECLRDLSRGGAGLVVIEIADIDSKRRYDEHVLGIFDDSLIPGWKKLVAAIHENGAKAIAQVIHAGNIPLVDADDPEDTGTVSASTVPHAYNPSRIPREMTVDEMMEVKSLYVAAARRVKEAGCDGIEVHCAHNHGLLATFVSPLHNKRTDEYGGNLVGRMKFPLEIIRAIREQSGPDFPISVRISACEMEDGGCTIDDTCLMAKLFEEAGVDFFDISNGTLTKSQFVIPPTGMPLALNADYAQKIKQAVSVPVGCVGRIKDPWTAEEIIRLGKADMVFIGRALLSDPEFPNKVMAGQVDDIRPCIGCTECVTSAMYGGPTTCSMNSALGHECDNEIGVCKTKKKILIAGGGPGGLEAARVAALRGHEVTIMEKAARLGGQFAIGAIPPAKQDLAAGLQYQIREVKRLGVNLIMGKEVTAQVVKEFSPDVVIAATGGKEIMPEWLMKGAHKNVCTAWEALAGVENIGRNILVIGGGQVGCETADYLAPHNYRNLGGRKVTIIEMQDNIMVDDYSPNRNMLVDRLNRKNVAIITGGKVETVLEDGIEYVADGAKHVLKGIDTIVAAMGTISENSLYEELKDSGIQVCLIGDAQQPRKIMQAVYEGAQAARQI